MCVIYFCIIWPSDLYYSAIEKKPEQISFVTVTEQLAGVFQCSVPHMSSELSQLQICSGFCIDIRCVDAIAHLQNLHIDVFYIN